MIYKIAPFIIVLIMFLAPITIAMIIDKKYRRTSLIFSSTKQKKKMGLDMYLIRYEETDSGSKTEEVVVAQWRKANAIHSYVVNKYADGVDDCQEIPLTLEDIAELNKLCKDVLDDPESARDKLPTASGFFFGSTAYDEWYLRDLKDTVTMLDYVQLMDKDWCHKYYYQASW